MSRVVLLGPQRLRPTVAAVVRNLGIEGRIAAVTAGWQEREGEDAELQDHLGGLTVNLALYQRAEEVFERDPELFSAHRERQNRLREMQGLYRLRLAHALAAVRELLDRTGDSDLLRQEQEEAFAAVRELDESHLRRIEAIHDRFDRQIAPRTRPAVERQRRSLAQTLESCGAVALAGGHVAVLLNRLRLFGLMELIGDRDLLAWSAGAMVLAERVVLFHDSPPQGPGNAQVLELGLGLGRELLPFPHARRRLRLDDRQRVTLLARRFAPHLCLTLDEGARVVIQQGRWRASGSVLELDSDGTTRTVPPRRRAALG